MNHQLKVHPSHFAPVMSGDKTFEIRENRNHGFQRGDLVTLAEFDPDKPGTVSGGYTGNKTTRLITYVSAIDQKDGFVVFGFSPDERT